MPRLAAAGHPLRSLRSASPYPAGRGRAGLQPAPTGVVPLCPTDISPASGGNQATLSAGGLVELEGH